MYIFCGNPTEQIIMPSIKSETLTHQENRLYYYNAKYTECIILNSNGAKGNWFLHLNLLLIKMHFLHFQMPKCSLLYFRSLDWIFYK